MDVVSWRNCLHRGSAVNDNQVRLEFDDFFRKTLRAIRVPCGPAIFELQIATLDPAKLAETSFQGLYAGPCFGIVFTDPHDDADSRCRFGLLCAGRTRPRR